MATNYKCEGCAMRAKYENSPKSFIGKFWRWHINFCPGWKAYFMQLPDEKKTALREKYKFVKYK